MKKGMDIFGEALLAYFQGDKTPLFIEDIKCNKYRHNLSKYFRTYKQLDLIEKEIIFRSNGKILDVGCGSGNYMPFLSKRGIVLGIDISSKVVQVGRERGLKNIKVADIFKLKTSEKFDTIVLLENNLGMAQTIHKTKKLLKILSALLTQKGQILTNAKIVSKADYFDGKMRLIWKNKKSDWIKWISFNPNFLGKLCAEAGLKMQVLRKNKQSYLARITKL